MSSGNYESYDYWHTVFGLAINLVLLACFVSYEEGVEGKVLEYSCLTYIFALVMLMTRIGANSV